MYATGTALLADWKRNELLSIGVTWAIKQVARTKQLSPSEIRAEIARLIAFNRKAEAGRWHDEDSMAQALICLGMIPETNINYQDSVALRRMLARDFGSLSLELALSSAN